jgi:tetratricopeptide (TPR) repeat protein
MDMVSWAAMDRIVERKIASDAKHRKHTAGRPLRSDAKLLTDGELLAKLRSFGIHLDRPSLERLCEQALSAEEIAKPLLDQRTFKGKREQLESDWIWICLAALWQRWFPDKPSFELLDDKMQAGYDLLASGGAAAACRTWLDAWSDVVRILDKTGIQSINEFDERFRGTQSLFNWIQDLEDDLWNAGLQDRQFLTARISVCEEGLRRFRADDDLMTENRRRALAESYYELGETDKAEALYREWLQSDPRWGWGWIGWSDCYQFTRTGLRNLERSEQLLRQGLSIAEVRDRSDLAERLADLCDEQGRGEEAKEFRRQARTSAAANETTLDVRSGGSVLRRKTTINFGGEGLPLSELSNVAAMLRGSSSQVTAGRQKVGRNEPCPCGSGKKFKKCCGGGLSTV